MRGGAEAGRGLPVLTAVAGTLATLVTLASFALPPSLSAQGRSELRLAGPGGDEIQVPVADHRGYAAVPTAALEGLGWKVRVGPTEVAARLADRVLVEMRAGSPFFTWNGELFQLVEAPYFFGERLYVPLQLVTAFLPRMLSDTYDYDPASRQIRALDAEHWTPRATAGSGIGSAGASGRGSVADPPPSPPKAGVVVVIDPGHGGRDTGALGPGGVREKDVALGVARALAEELRRDRGIEVRLTREGDVLIPIWQRGEMATAWKGDRPGIFISLHANAASSRARGFETYFLSEARTEHETRVAALENSAMAMETSAEGGGPELGQDLGFILSDLRNRDHLRWSARLAQLVQDELAPVHPGPNRGVKQGPFAVITNALMPAVLVELGFITHATEAGLLARADFQHDVARSLAEAVRTFFERYPTGSEPSAR